MLFLILFILFIFIKFGLLAAIQSIIWIVVFLSSNFLSGINPDKIEYKVIRFISLLAILMIVYVNSVTPNIISTLVPISPTNFMKFVLIKSLGSRFFMATALLQKQYPYSLFDITKLIEIKSYKHTGDVLLKGVFYDWYPETFSKFLNQLHEDKIYAVTVEFVQDYSLYDDLKPYPKVLLSDPIVITKSSDGGIISSFVHKQIDILESYQTNFSTTNPKSAVVLLLTEIEIK